MEHSEEEDGDCCRICRCGAEAGALFFPCKCSGSIKFVHSQCLLDWLTHSGNEFCEVCKHRFSFTPVYAADAPATLPWHELLFGLIKRVFRGIKLAHRVWVVSCVWLILVPWITCLAWRLAFLRGFNELGPTLRQRFNVLAVATDCIQGSLLSVGIVFLNMAVASLKDQLRSAVTSLEQQLVRDTGTAAAAPGAGAAAAADAPAAAAAAAAAAGAERPAAAAAEGPAAAAAEGPAAAAEAVVAGAEQAAEPASPPASASASQDVNTTTLGNTAAAPGPAAAASASSAPEATASSSSGSSSSGSSSPGTSQTAGAPAAAAAGPSNPAAADLQQQQQQHAEQQQQQQRHEPAAAPAAAAVHDDAAAEDAAAEDGDGWADVPFEELLGLQGPWVNFLETIVLVMIGNAFFMLGVVYLPLNAGRLLLSALRQACQSLSPEQQLLLQQMLSQQLQLPFVSDVASFVLSLLINAPAGAAAAAANAAAAAANATVAAAGAAAAALAANASSVVAGAVAAVAANTTAAAAGAAAAATVGGGLTAAAAAATAGLANATSAAAAAAAAADPVVLLYPPLDAEPLPLVALSLDQVFRELHSQLELPAGADFVALSLGHTLLAVVLLLGLWAYAAGRLWRAASRRVRLAGRRPLVEVLQSSGRWLLSAASLLGQGLKLALLLSIELGAFPLAAGLWLDICALPLTSTSIAQRGEALARSPVMSGLMHWVLGVGFLLGFTFLMCVTREVLRPGALPFLRDPTNPERNPVKEMLDEPLLRHLGRVVASSLAYAGLCVVLVHLPALLAHALVPSLYPLRVALFDPLTQIPADMLLLHIFVPFTVEHVRVKGAVKAAVHSWLAFAGRLLGWGDYLLPLPDEEAAPAAAAAQPAPAAQQPPPAAEAGAGAGTAAQQEQQDAAAGAEAAAAASPSTSAASASPQQAASAAEPLAAADQQQQQSGADQERQPLLQPAAAAAAPVQAAQQQQQHRHPVGWYEQHASYPTKLLGLAAAWLLTMVVLNCLLLTVPIGLGRALFRALNLPFKNDLFTGAMGLLALWGGHTLATGVANSASVRNSRAVLAAAGRWLLLAGQCGVLLVLWLGVVATMLGVLCELVLLPLRLPPNQTALIYLYQDWTMGVLALKLWHLLVIVAPRREGRPAPDPDSWQAHFEAVQAGGLRHLDFNRALTKIVAPILLHLATCLAVPYIVTRGLLPLLRLPAVVLQYANLWGYAVYHGMYLGFLGWRKLHQWARQLHNTIRDDRYLVGRELNNFELQQQQQQLALMQAAGPGAEEKLATQLPPQEQDQQQQGPELAAGGAVAAAAAADGGGSSSSGAGSRLGSS